MAGGARLWLRKGWHLIDASHAVVAEVAQPGLNSGLNHLTELRKPRMIHMPTASRAADGLRWPADALRWLLRAARLGCAGRLQSGNLQRLPKACGQAEWCACEEGAYA
jgi:hypothetical protein